MVAQLVQPWLCVHQRQAQAWLVFWAREADDGLFLPLI